MSKQEQRFSAEQDAKAIAANKAEAVPLFPMEEDICDWAVQYDQL